MISTPLCLLDCDLPVDGSTAFVLSHAACANDRPQPTGVHRRRRHRDARATVVGPVRRPHGDGGHRGRPHICGSAVRSGPTMSTPRSSTTASPSWSWCGWRRWASAREAAQRNSRPPASCPRVDGCPPTRSAASCRRDACTASGICTRRARRSAVPPARGSWRPRRRWSPSPTAAVRSPAACCSPPSQCADSQADVTAVNTSEASRPANQGSEGIGRRSTDWSTLDATGTIAASEAPPASWRHRRGRHGWKRNRGLAMLSAP